jgi:hypothetical protein
VASASFSNIIGALNTSLSTVQITASVVNSPQITGSLFGTASWAQNSVSASWAPTSGTTTTGSVTSVSVTTNAGVSGTVANSTTAPAISITLGAITPTSISTGQITGSIISGSQFTGSLFGTASFSQNAQTYSSSFSTSDTTNSASFTTTISSLTANVTTNSSSLLALSSSYQTTSASFTSKELADSGSLLTLSSSYVVSSASFSTRVFKDSGSLLALSASYLASSASFTAKELADSGSLLALSSSYVASSASFSTRIFTDSGSLLTTSASLLSLSSSYQTTSASFTEKELADSGSLLLVSSSLVVSSASFSSRLVALSSSFNSSQITGSIISGSQITGSVFGTSSYSAEAAISSKADPTGIFRVERTSAGGNAVIYLGGQDLNGLLIIGCSAGASNGVIGISNSKGFVIQRGNYGYGFITGLADANASADTVITSPGAGNLQFGNADAAAAVPQTMSMQSVVAGTSDTQGRDFVLAGSRGTGLGGGGSVIIKIAPVGPTGTAQNTLSAIATFSSSYITILSGSLSVSTSITASSALITQITGSVFGTSSWAQNSISASWAPTSGTSATGSVTNVSVNTSNGVSGTVQNATTTPAITVTLGRIVPTDVTSSFSGNITGSLFGTASWSVNAISASWAPTAGTSATGSVTSVSVATANGVSGTVQNATTTPSITLTLGRITPTDVTSSFSGSLDGTASFSSNALSYSSSLTSTISNLTSNVTTNSSSLLSVSASFVASSASFSTRIFTNSGSLLALSSSYQTTSASFTAKELADSGSLLALSSSYQATSASFTARELADSGSLLTVSSSFVNSSASFSSRLVALSGSFNSTQVTSSFINSSQITGSLFGTASWAANATASGFYTAIGTGSQSVLSVNTFNEINFSNILTPSPAWTHSTSSGQFTCSLGGLYEVTLTTYMQKTGSGTLVGATRLVLDNLEISGSYSAFSFTANNVPQPLVSKVIIPVLSGSALRAEFAGNSGSMQVIPPPSIATSHSKPSVSILISKL